MSITIYKAKQIITMNQRKPRAEYVAVRDGLILGCGDLESLQGWGEYKLDTQFEDKIVCPGFIEGHSHSWEGAAWENSYIGFLDRTAPDLVVHPGLKTIDQVIARLKQDEAAATDKSKALQAWGIDPLFLERRITLSDLDSVATDRAVVLVHQSGHIVNVNSYTLKKSGIDNNTDVDGLVRDEQGNITGELMGIALYMAVLKAVGIGSVLDLGDNAEASLWRFARSAQIAGVTTITDLASELSDEIMHEQAKVAAQEDYPIRIVPAFVGQMAPSEDGVKHVQACIPQSNNKLRYGLIKLILDGSIQGFTARFKEPGYYNGHENGQWYIDPNDLVNVITPYHAAGMQIHIHTNGDDATEVALDAIETVLKAHPDADARFTLQHCQMAHDAHLKRMAKLGVCANFFANHIYYYGDQHRDITMGPERAERIDPAGSAERFGVNYSIHSDAPVTHLAPLFTAWCAVNRQTYSGEVLGAAESISVQQALHAITIGAAYTLKLDTEIGSIETGKQADFTVLESDPFESLPSELKDIKVWGTVLGGKVFPLANITN